MTTPPPPFAALAALASDTDPIARAKALGAALNAIPDLQAWLRAERQQSVSQANQTQTQDQIADQLNLSKSSVSRIINNSPSGTGTGGRPGRPKKT